MKRNTACSLIFFCCCSLCTAQQLVSSGGYTVKSDISVNWILGGSLSDILTYDLATLNKIKKDQMMKTEISFKAYPNPVTDFINIEITPIDTGWFIFELYNNSGVRVLNESVVCQPVMKVNMSDIPSGIYLLKAILPSSKNQPLKVEKIIKY